MKNLLVVGIVLAAATVGSADTVHLYSGATFEGIVTEAGDRITVTMDFGSVTFRRCDVERIVLKDSPLQQFIEKAKRASTVAEKLELADWAKGRQLDSQAKGLY